MATSVLRARRFRVPALAASAALAITFVPTGTGAASPHLTISQVKAQIAALNTKAEKITEAYDQANTNLKALRRKERVTSSLLARDRRALASSQKVVARAAAAAYRSGGLDATMSLVSTGSAQTFLDQTSGLEQVARYQASQVAAAGAAQRAVAADEVVHSAQVTQQRKVLSSISAQRRQIQGLLGQQKAILGRLTAAARQRLAAQQAATTQHQVAQRSSYHAPSYNGPASGQAATAVRFAYAQLGKPYVYGGAGPSSYDCSGLTMRAWGAAGVSLPHNAAAQQSSIPAVSISNLEPGDLVFFGSPAYHVAIYIGGGRIIQAPHTGASVEITPLSYMTPSGAGRP